MIEIRSAAPFCPVLATCHPSQVDAMLAALGLTREKVVLTAPDRRTELEMLREELAHANATNASQRDDLNNSEDRNRERREEINKARAAKHAAEAERMKRGRPSAASSRRSASIPTWCARLIPTDVDQAVTEGS